MDIAHFLSNASSFFKYYESPLKKTGDYPLFLMSKEKTLTGLFGYLSYVVISC